MTTTSGWWQRARFYWAGIIGESAYERYVAHLRRHHPDADVPTVKEFWRQHYAEQEANPKSRCC